MNSSVKDFTEIEINLIIRGLTILPDLTNEEIEIIRALVNKLIKQNEPNN